MMWIIHKTLDYKNINLRNDIKGLGPLSFSRRNFLESLFGVAAAGWVFTPEDAEAAPKSKKKPAPARPRSAKPPAKPAAPATYKPPAVPHVLMDKAGNIISEHSARVRRDHASLTKPMALYLVMKALTDPNVKFDTDSDVTIPKIIRSVSDLATLDKLKAGNIVKARDLLIAAGSRSDAKSTVALALHVAKVYNWQGTESQKLARFIEEMNKTAIKLGLNDTHYSNCTGKTGKNHYSTPYDTAILLRKINGEFPWLSKLAMGQAKFDIHTISNASQHTSKFLRRHDKEVSFAKTGYTRAAGYCLGVAGSTYTGVVLGAKSRNHYNGIMEDLSKRARSLAAAPQAPRPVLAQD